MFIIYVTQPTSITSPYPCPWIVSSDVTETVYVH